MMYDDDDDPLTLPTSFLRWNSKLTRDKIFLPIGFVKVGKQCWHVRNWTSMNEYNYVRIKVSIPQVRCTAQKYLAT